MYTVFLCTVNIIIIINMEPKGKEGLEIRWKELERIFWDFLKRA